MYAQSVNQARFPFLSGRFVANREAHVRRIFNSILKKI